jgi:hypothetical protein
MTHFREKLGIATKRTICYYLNLRKKVGKSAGCGRLGRSLFSPDEHPTNFRVDGIK